jgi:hypothetical protein
MANQSYKILISAKDKASASFKSLNKVAGKTGQIVGGLTKGVATATVALTAASVAVAAVARSSFEFADAIGKVSTRTGIATDTVQAFQIAAVESGSSVEIANKSLEKFTRSVGDAQRGLKTQADIFKDLGVSIQDANGNTKTMDVLLREVSDGMAGLKSQSEKATVAANLFGRAGIQIVDILDNGGAAFDAYIDKAKEYGLVLSEDGIRQSEKFNDTLAFINRQFKTATAAISIAFLPILQNLATAFKELIAETVSADEGIMEFGESIRDIVLKQVDGFIKGFGDFLDAIHNVRRGLVQFAIDVERKFLETELATLKFRKSMDILGLATETFDALIRATSTALDENSNKMRVFDAQNKSSGDTVRKFGNDLEKHFVKVLGMSDDEVKNLVDSYTALENVAANSLTNLLDPLDAYKTSLSDAQIEIVDFGNAQVNAFKKAEDALVSFVQTGKLNFKDLIDSLIADLARLAIRQRLISPLFSLFSDFTNGNTPAPIPAGNFNVSSFDGGGFTGLGNRAGGIDGKGGFPAILHPNETVIDHTKGNNGSSIVINQSVNFATGVQDTVKNEVLQLLPDIAETSKGAVLEAMSRGGNFRRGMR